MQGGARGTRPPVAECSGWESVLREGGKGQTHKQPRTKGRRERQKTGAMDAERGSEETRARLTRTTGDAGDGGRRPQHRAGTVGCANADEKTAHNGATRCSTPRTQKKSEQSKQ